MKPVADPYAHHPELRGKIGDPLQSFFRTFRPEDLASQMAAQGLPPEWLHTAVQREASRAEILAGHAGDLWVFAYGSLMWDPAVRFVEVRRAQVADHARRFILKDVFGGRGTLEQPGLMAALDRLDTGSGAVCEGLVFRIAADDIAVETELLWRRELAGPAYVPAFVEAMVAETPVQTLTFVADHGSDAIDAGLTREEQIRFIATGAGFLGTSLAYLSNIASHFEALDIDDAEVFSLLEATRAYLARAAGTPG